MKLAWFKLNSAWQPLTFKGVAAFANAPWRRLALVQFIVALLIAGTVAWFLNHAWFPTVRDAILQMPERGEIVSGRLNWTNESPRLLAEGPCLAFICDLRHTGEIRVPAHIQLELGATDVRLISLFGYADRAYPRRETIEFNRLTYEPRWGAWQTPMLWIAFGGALTVLMFTWWVLASLYLIPVRLIGFFSNRELSLAGSWKLAGAALMPGALLLMAALLMYGFGWLDPVQLIAAQIVHWIIGWVYCCASVFALPKISTGVIEDKNPFETEDEVKRSSATGAGSDNPFKSPRK